MHSLKYSCNLVKWGFRSFTLPMQTASQKLTETLCGDYLASFPGLPHFYLPFVFTIIHRSRRRGRPGSIHHVSGRKVDIRGEGAISKYARTKLESEFLTGQDK